MTELKLKDGTQYAAIWKKTENLVVLHYRILGSIVEFDFDIKYMACELGPFSDFEILGEL